MHAVQWLLQHEQFLMFGCGSSVLIGIGGVVLVG